MTRSSDRQLTTDWIRARIRLGMIARMARLNMEQIPSESEFTEVMQTILAASTFEDEH